MKNKVYKLLSIVLAIAVVLSCCAIEFATAADESTAKAIYYLDGGSGKDSNNGLTKETAFKTYRGAIEKALADANAGGYNTAESTVYFKVVDSDKTTQWYDGTVHNSHDAPAHNFKVIITTTGTATKSHLGTSNGSMTLYGPTVFKDIYYNYGTGATGVNFGVAHSLTLDSSIQQRYQAGPLILGTHSNKVNTTTFDHPITFTNNSTWLFRKIGLGSYLNAKYNADVNVVFNNSKELPYIYSTLDYTYDTHNFAFGSGYTGYKSTFNKNVNFNFINASDVTFIKNEGDFAFGENAAVQVINSTGKAVKYDDTMQAALFGDTALVDTFVLNNNTGDANLIQFTENAGEYTVDSSKYIVTATATDGSGTKYDSKDNLLAIKTPGEYELTYTAVVPNEYLVYYISANATGTSDGTKAAPFKTIGEALTAAIAKDDGKYNVKGSDVYFKILDTSPVVYSDVTGIAFNFTLNISSDIQGAVLDNGKSAVVKFAGRVNLENVTLEHYKGGEIYLDGNDFIFGNNASISTDLGSGQHYFCLGRTSTTDAITTSQEVHFKNNDSQSIVWFALGGGLTTTYEADLTLVYDAPNNAQSILFDTVAGSSRNYYLNINKNLNFDFRSTKGITFKKHNGRCNFGPNAAVQIINSSNSTIDTSEITLPTDRTYILNNSSGIKDALTFNETAGTYAVKEGYYVTATPVNGGSSVSDRNGFLVLEPGEYNLEITRDPIVKEYYVSPTGIDVEKGTRPETAGTKENPVKTFVDVTYLLQQDGLTSIDTAMVYFESGKVNGWNKEDPVDPHNGTYYLPEKYNCKVIVDSTDPNNKASIENHWTIRFRGETEVRNVKMKITYSYSHMNTANSNVTFAEGSEIDTPALYTWYYQDASPFSKDINVNVKGTLKTSSFILEDPNIAYTTTGNINVCIDSATAQVPFVFGKKGGTYKNININVKNAASLSFAHSGATTTFNGGLHVIADDDVELPDSTRTGFESLAITYKWYITNKAFNDNFITFSNEKGKFTVSGGVTAYSRQFGDASSTKHTGGTVNLSAKTGIHVVSDKEIDALTDDSHKMLYFYTTGANAFDHKIFSGTYELEAGETYVFGLSVYCDNYDKLKIHVGNPDSGNKIAEPVIISDVKNGNYHNITCEVTIPAGYGKTWALFGISVAPYTQGVIFDRSFSIKSGSSSSYIDNMDFLNGLNGVRLDSTWMTKGITNWSNDAHQLKVMNYDADFITKLVAAEKPSDGTSWTSEIHSEDIRSLVSAAENKGKVYVDSEYRGIIDKNKDRVIDAKDNEIIRKTLLSIAEEETPFSYEYESAVKTERDALYNTIMNEGHNVSLGSGSTYYVSSLKTGSQEVGSATNPFTSLDQIPTLQSGDNVFFERGSVFRITDAFVCKAGVTYTSYGDLSKAKPAFYGSARNFAEVTWTASNKRYVWKINYSDSDDLAGGFFDNGQVGVRKPSIRALYKDMDFYLDSANGILYLYSEKGKPSDVWDSIEFSIPETRFNILAGVSNVTIDDLTLKYMGYGVSACSNNNNITVTYCEIGYIGGEMDSNGARKGNGIQSWDGGQNHKWEYNWVYQTFDTAVSPQGDYGKAFTNFSICNNLFEYNNADIELWEHGANNSVANGVISGITMSNNIHSFTSLGWGTRQEEGVRGIQGIQVGAIHTGNTYKNVKWTNNIIYCPGDFVYNKNSGSETTTEYNNFVRQNNTYYIKQSMRRHNGVASSFHWNTSGEVESVSASTKDEWTAAINKLETGSTVNWQQ